MGIDEACRTSASDISCLGLGVFQCFFLDYLDYLDFLDFLFFLLEFLILFTYNLDFQDYRFGGSDDLDGVGEHPTVKEGVHEGWQR